MNRLIPSFVKDVFIYHEVEHTCVDGKVKATWTESATSVCYICGANSEERAKRFSPMFVSKIKGNPEDKLALGPSTCHMLQRALEWCITACTHRDIETRKEPDTAVEQEMVADRLKELQDEAEARMGNLKISKMASGSNQVTMLLLIHLVHSFCAVAYQSPTSAFSPSAASFPF